MVMASPHNWLRLLRIVQGLLLAAILWTGWRLAGGDRGSPDGPTAHPPQVKPTTGTRPADAAPTLDAYASIWQRNWKQPLIDPPPPPPRVEAPKAPPPLRVRLIGTMVEPDSRFALFVDENRQLKTKAIGEQIDQFTIAAIERGKVQLVQGERKIWLEVPNTGKS